jgi:hypothetical protein
MLFSNDFEVQPYTLEDTEKIVRSRLAEQGEMRSLRSRRRAASVGSSAPDPFVASMVSHSRLIDRNGIQALRLYLGVYSADDFNLCYSTYRDGWSLDTLYALTAHKAPCIIVLRSLEQRAVLGAFLPVAISPPSQRVRGDGRSFVFRLDGQNAQCYKWTHRSRQHGATGAGSVPVTGADASGPETGPERDDISGEALAHQQFAVCSINYIIIGGSAVHGTNALRLDSDLRSCFCGPSDTFENEPLVPEEETQPFAVGETMRLLAACLCTLHWL